MVSLGGKELIYVIVSHHPLALTACYISTEVVSGAIAQVLDTGENTEYSFRSMRLVLCSNEYAWPLSHLLHDMQKAP